MKDVGGMCSCRREGERENGGWVGVDVVVVIAVGRWWKGEQGGFEVRDGGWSLVFA